MPRARFALRRLRLYDPEFYCEVTIRALDGWFAFDPNDIDSREQIYGLLAEAARRTGVAIFVFHFMTNHYHGLYGYSSPVQIVDFLSYLHGGLARLGNDRLRRRGTFWGKPKVMAVSADAASVARRFRYIMGQAVRAGICHHPAEFLGASAVDALLFGTPLIGRKIDRSRRTRDRLRLVGGAKDDSVYETRVEVPLATPACWADLTAAELRGLYQGIAAEIAADQSEPRAEPDWRTQAAVPVPGTCLSHENATDFASFPGSDWPPGPRSQLLAPPEVALPLKVSVPEREAEEGGHYSHGPVRPKTLNGRKTPSRVPMLYSIDRQMAVAYEERYKRAEQAYRAAKRAWRAKSRRRKGALRGAKVRLPAWMLLGTLPLFLRE